MFQEKDSKPKAGDTQKPAESPGEMQRQIQPLLAEGCESRDMKQQLKYGGEEPGHSAKVFVRRNYLWLVSSVPGETFDYCLFSNSAASSRILVEIGSPNIQNN